MVRGGGASSVAKSTKEIVAPRLPFKAPDPWVRGRSSVIEFHAPHASHRPDQRACTAPQSAHVKVEMFFAMT